MKGNQWHIGMKAHIGVDSDTGIVHSINATPANSHDVTEAHKLLHGGETVVWCQWRRRDNWRRSARILRINAGLRAASNLKHPGQGAKLKRPSAGHQTPDRSFHRLRRSVKHNPGQNGLVQKILMYPG